MQADSAAISYLATALTLMQVELVDYGMNSVSQGIDAMAITRVVIRPTGQNVKPGVTPQVLRFGIRFRSKLCNPVAII